MLHRETKTREARHASQTFECSSHQFRKLSFGVSWSQFGRELLLTPTSNWEGLPDFTHGGQILCHLLTARCIRMNSLRNVQISFQDCPPVNSGDTRGQPQHPDEHFSDRTTLPATRSKLNTDDGESLQIGPVGIGQVVSKNSSGSWYHSDADVLPHDQLLHPDYAPNIVHIVWCGRRWFEFHHYINILSLIKELHPDEIDFFYDEYPVLDEWVYNNWIEELKTEYPFFRTIKIDPSISGPGCQQHGRPNNAFILHLLTYYGGIYLNENTLVAKFPLKFRSYDLIEAMDPVTGYGFVMAKRNLPVDTDLAGIKKNGTYATLQVQCHSQLDYDHLGERLSCITSDQRYFPKDIWDLDTPWGRLNRRIFYGSPKIPVPKQSFDELIPNIGHIVWIGGGEMDFLFYLCVLSLLYVQEVDVLYIHGNAPPSGPLWIRLKDHPKIKLIHRYTSMQVYGNDINILSHVTDVWRVDFMIKYGGEY